MWRPHGSLACLYYLSWTAMIWLWYGLYGLVVYPNYRVWLIWTLWQPCDQPCLPAQVNKTYPDMSDINPGPLIYPDIRPTLTSDLAMWRTLSSWRSTLVNKNYPDMPDIHPGHVTYPDIWPSHVTYPVFLRKYQAWSIWPPWHPAWPRVSQFKSPCKKINNIIPDDSYTCI